MIKLGPISMGERLRIGGDMDSDEEAEDATPSPLPAAQPQLVKRQYKRKTVDVSEGVLHLGSYERLSLLLLPLAAAASVIGTA